jgi:adenylate cyclase
VSLLRFEWEAAERRFQRAIALKPGYSAAHLWYADLLSRLKRLPEAHAVIDKALAADPFSTTLNAESGNLLIFDRRYGEAVAQLEKTLHMDPAFAKTHLALAEVYGYTRDFTRALTAVQKAPAADAVADGTTGYVLAAAGRRRDAGRLATDLERRYAAGEYNAACAAAAVHAGLGESDQALLWLERGLERRESWITYIAIDPRFDSLRSNPRFVKLLAALGLPR